MSNKIQLQTNNIKLDGLIEVLKGKAVGSSEPELPTLTNEGTAADILLGKQLINSNKEVITGTIPSQEAQTITPMTTDQTIDSGKYLAGAQTIKGDANLIAENIKSGISIFGVEGTCKGASSLLGAYSYSSSNQPIDDGDGNWRIKFLQSGTLTVAEDVHVDIFAVGGGGNGATVTYSSDSGRGGGGGGYTKTVRNIKLEKDKTYTVAIGAAQGESSFSGADGTVYCNAAGGKSATSYSGANGGSGGGPGALQTTIGRPGSNGSNGTNTSSTYTGGIGQGTTTREFGEEDGDLYAGGGGGGGAASQYYVEFVPGGEGGGGNGGTSREIATNGGENTGGGGGGGAASTGYGNGGTGGSGIVIIRNARVITMITFFIDGTEYQAISGMDWGTWCDSEFNTDYWTDVGPGPTDRGDCIGYANTYIVDGDEYVIKEDLIIDGQEYSTLYNNKQ